MREFFESEIGEVLNIILERDLLSITPYKGPISILTEIAERLMRFVLYEKTNKNIQGFSAITRLGKDVPHFKSNQIPLLLKEDAILIHKDSYSMHGGEEKTPFKEYTGRLYIPWEAYDIREDRRLRALWAALCPESPNDYANIFANTNIDSSSFVSFKSSYLPGGKSNWIEPDFQKQILPYRRVSPYRGRRSITIDPIYLPYFSEIVPGMRAVSNKSFFGFYNSSSTCRPFVRKEDMKQMPSSILRLFLWYYEALLLVLESPFSEFFYMSYPKRVSYARLESKGPVFSKRTRTISVEKIPVIAVGDLCKPGFPYHSKRVFTYEPEGFLSPDKPIYKKIGIPISCSEEITLKERWAKHKVSAQTNATCNIKALKKFLRSP